MTDVDDLLDELARELDVHREDLAIEVDRLRTSANVRRRAVDAIGSIHQTTLQGPAAADVLRTDGGRP